jgi:hypothetical protein
MKRPRDKVNKQRLFLGNGSVTTFPLVGSCNSTTTAMETGVFSMRYVPRCYERDSSKQRVQLRDGGQPAMARARETEESPLLEAVARKWLVMRQQARKVFAGAVVIHGLWRLAVALYFRLVYIVISNPNPIYSNTQILWERQCFTC